MKQKILFLSIGIMAATAAFLLISRKPAPPVQPPIAADETVAGEPANLVQTETLPVSQPAVQPMAEVRLAPANAPVSAWTKLVEKYGPEKTALSSKVTSNLTSVIKEGIELANTAARNSGSSSLAEAAGKEMVRSASTQMGLTEEQQKQAAAMIQGAVGKRMQAVEELTQAMGSEPERMMELMLAGDALARNQITRAEYDGLTGPTQAMLKNVTGFITGGPGGRAGSQLLLDPQTTAELNAILTPEQQTKLAEMTAAVAQKIQARQEAQAARGGFQPGEIPVMEIEKLDQAVRFLQADDGSGPAHDGGNEESEGCQHQARRAVILPGLARFLSDSMRATTAHIKFSSFYSR